MIASLLLGSTVFAQVLQNTKEAINNEAQIKAGKEQLKRDTKEKKAFSSLVAAYQKAGDAKEWDKMHQLKTMLENEMRREVEQSQQKLTQAQREVQQSKQEIRSDRREIRRNRRDSRNSTADAKDDRRDARRDRANKRDDRRDKRDDQRDYAKLDTRLDAQQNILSSVSTMAIHADDSGWQNYLKSLELLGQFEQTLEADLVATKTELKEDKRERREDRRERRDDRRERREGRTDMN